MNDNTINNVTMSTNVSNKEDKIMNTLSINFYAENISDSNKSDFMLAISHEASLMNIQLLDDMIAKLDVKIANKKSYTEEEIEGFTAQRNKYNNLRTEYINDSNNTEDTYNTVVANMSAKNEDGFGNNKDVVRTVLRVLATWNNSKLVKYAIIPAFQSFALYDALETIHIKSKACEDGNVSMTKEVKEAYKKASDEIESIIKNTFSLPFPTQYTDKTRVKMTAEDKKLLNDCYVKGFSNKFSVDDKTGVVTYDKRNINTLVKVKKDRKTKTSKPDYSGLAGTIASIVMKHYFA